ncbi:MAG: MoxR family ATPase, partial [Acidimicrobiales bacterium]|nr:MoxR family ATPase [Acidimicrobiales bacterium]
LDRFMFKIDVGFPTADELHEIVGRTTSGASATPSSVTDAAELQQMIALTRQVPAASHVTRHAVDLVVATHPGGAGAPGEIAKYVRNGASPRGAQALMLGAKATALLDGRPSASVDDVRAVAGSALRHRLVLGFEAIADGVSPAQLIEAVMDAVPAPASGVRGAP